MAVPYRLLMDGEVVVVHRHPHARVLVRPAVVTVVTVGLAGLLIAVVPQSNIRWGIGAVALVIGLAAVSRPVLHWLTTTLTVTDRRLLLRSGVFSRYGRDIPLGRIEEVSFEHTLLERALGCGTLYVELAADRGMVVVQNVPRIVSVQAAIYELLEDGYVGAEPEEPEELEDWVDEDWDEDPDEETEPASGRRWLRRRRPVVN